MSSDAKVLGNLIKHMKARADDPLRPLVDEYMLLRDKSEERLEGYHIDMRAAKRPPGRLSPSSMGGCERQAMFKFVGMPGKKRVDPDLQILFDDGDWRHHRWQATFRDMELVLGTEKFEVISIEERVSLPRLFISGSIDAVAKINGVTWLIDFKGINSYGFRYLKDENKAKREYILQIITYMRLRKIRRGLLFFEDKNTQETRSFVINFDKKEWAYVERWAGRIIKAMDRRELPEKHPECTNGHYLWGRCAFADWCFGKDPEQTRRRAYRDFDGVAEQWEAGMKLLEA